MSYNAKVNIIMYGLIIGMASYLAWLVFVNGDKNTEQLDYLSGVCNGVIIREPYNSPYFAVCIQQGGEVIYPSKECTE
jgi:hypothetical protein